MRTPTFPMAACVLALCMALPASALAERFPVSARVFCPASFSLDASGNPRAVDASFDDASVLFAPCAGVKVRVMDADTDWDDLCAEAYTDTQGRISLEASCGDGPGAGSPDVYLSIEGRSAFGFSVGTWDYGFWDALGDIIESVGEAVVTNGWSAVIELAGGADFPDAIVAHEPAQWVTEERLGRDGVSIDFGDRSMGDDWSAGTAPATAQEAPLWAAREFWIGHRTLAQIRAASTYRPFYFHWTVDHPWFGAPTTLWDTVIVDVDRMRDAGERADSLRATPHEIGHVLHNRYHSGYSHWIYADALGYAKTHDQCGEDTLVLAWYEGFANFVEDWAYSAVSAPGSMRALPGPVTSWRSATGPAWQPFEGCAQAGLAIEGNVQTVFDRIYYGPLDATYDLLHTPVEAEYSCPPGLTLEQRGPTVWRCVRERPSLCPPTSDRRVVDAQGQTDLCEQDPEPGLPWGGLVETGLILPCADTTACIELLFPQLSFSVASVDPTSGATTQITIEPTHDENGEPLPEDPAEPTVVPGSGIVQVDPADLIDGDLSSATRIDPPGCSDWDDPTGTIALVRRPGLDVCLEDGPATWMPPLDPAAPFVWRRDGHSRSVIAPTAWATREWFALPDLPDVVRWIEDSGSGAHRLQEHWDASIGPFCRGADRVGRLWYCNPDASPVFLQEIGPHGTLQTGP